VTKLDFMITVSDCTAAQATAALWRCAHQVDAELALGREARHGGVESDSERGREPGARVAEDGVREFVSFLGGERRVRGLGGDRDQSAILVGLERMAARGELRPNAETDALAQRTLAAVQGGLLLTQIRRDPAQLRSALDGALEAIEAARTQP
jgi:hypothetical protein